MTRSTLALRLLWIFGGTVGAVLGLAASNTLALSKSLPILTAVVGVVAGALGFYFGGHEHQD